MKPIPMPDVHLPALEPLVNGGLWQSWAEQGRVFELANVPAAVRYLRLKPRTSCRLTLFSNGDGAGPESPQGFLLHLYADLDRARVAWDKITARPRREGIGGYEPFFSAPQALVAVPFPLDPEIPGLRHVYRGHRLKAALREILADDPGAHREAVKRDTLLRLLAYKPGRRAVFRLDTRLEHESRPGSLRLALHVKVESPQSFDRSWSNLTRIHAGRADGEGPSVPEPRGRAVGRCMAASQWVEGESLLAACCAGRAREALRETGAALAELHRLDARLPASSNLFTVASLRSLAEDLARLLPDQGKAILELGSRLASAAAFLVRSPETTVHGDFHLGQVILTPNGRAVLVDLDRAGVGHRLIDVATLLAHLEECGFDRLHAETFLHGYEEAANRALDGAAVNAATAAALFRRAMVPFRELDPEWPTQVLRRLDRVARLLDRGGS